MPKYRKIPVVINAVRFDPDNLSQEEWFQTALHSGTIHYGGETYGEGHWRIRTKEGPLNLNPGEYVIQGVEGEIYPCDPGIFAKTYESVETP